MQRSWFYLVWTEPSYRWLQHMLATDCWWNLEAKLFFHHLWYVTSYGAFTHGDVIQ